MKFLGHRCRWQHYGLSSRRIGTTTWCYDAHGNVTLKRQIIGANTYATSYSWNAADRLMGMTYPMGPA